MRRRDFMKWAAGGVGVLAFPVPLLGGQAKPFNLLILHTDEHSFRTLGCYRRLLPREQAGT